jgi:thiol-disulfide isomerase/thioredoxin
MNFRKLLFVFLCVLASAAQAVEYVLPDLQGRMQSLQQYRGKWLIVNYWASWCQSCIKEIPELNALHTHLASQDVVVVGVNFESLDVASLQTVVRTAGIQYPVLRSEPVPETPLGRVPALPTTYIIDPQGAVVAGQVGVVTRKDIEMYLRKKGLADRGS